MARKYLELGADPYIENSMRQSALHMAAMFNMFSMLLTLVKHYSMGLDQVDSEGFTPLQLAIKDKNEDMALLIISLSQEADIRKTTALSMAVTTKSYKITKHLLLNAKYEPVDIKASTKNCTDKDISKLLVRIIQNKSGKIRKFPKFVLLIFGILFKESFRVIQILFYLDQVNFLVLIEILVQFLLFFCVFMSLLFVTLKNPGFEKQSKMNLCVKLI